MHPHALSGTAPPPCSALCSLHRAAVLLRTASPHRTGPLAPRRRTAPHRAACTAPPWTACTAPPHCSTPRRLHHPASLDGHLPRCWMTAAVPRRTVPTDSLDGCPGKKRFQPAGRSNFRENWDFLIPNPNYRELEISGFLIFRKFSGVISENPKFLYPEFPVPNFREILNSNNNKMNFNSFLPVSI